HHRRYWARPFPKRDRFGVRLARCDRPPGASTSVTAGHGVIILKFPSPRWKRNHIPLGGITGRGCDLNPVLDAGSRLRPLTPIQWAAAVGGVFVIVAAVAFVLVWFVVLPSQRRPRRCPSCHGSRVRPSWPRRLDRLTPWLVPFRCEMCTTRYHVFRDRD